MVWKWLALLLLVPVILYGLACFMIYRDQESLLFFPRPLPRDFEYRFGSPAEEVFLPVDNYEIALVHFRQPEAQGVVLHFHGNGTIIADVDAVAQGFLSRGYDAVFFDYRGYGKSSGSITSEADLHRDAEAAYAYVAQHYPPEQIIFYGHSLGTGLATRLATIVPPRLLILESPYFSMRDVAAYHMPWVPIDLLRYQLRTDQWIGSVTAPIVLIHGTNDTLIPFHSSERLLPLITSSGELVTIEGGAHNNLAAFSRYHATLDRLLGERR